MQRDTKLIDWLNNGRVITEFLRLKIEHKRFSLHTNLFGMVYNLYHYTDWFAEVQKASEKIQSLDTDNDANFQKLKTIGFCWQKDDRQHGGWLAMMFSVVNSLLISGCEQHQRA